MKRFLALILAAVLMVSCALAEDEGAIDVSMAANDAVRLLFAAAAGTETEAETALREDMTAEEQEMRTADNAVYRKTVLPWLIEALDIEPNGETKDASILAIIKEEDGEAPEISEDADEAVEPTETAEPTEAELWGLAVEAGFETLKANEYGAAFLAFINENMVLLPVSEDETDADGEATDAVSEPVSECAYYLELTRAYLRVWLDEISASRLKALNDDFAFWLYSADTPIDYPVVQCGDNDYYLHRMFNGEKNSAGTLFADYRNLPDFLDPNTLVYGHHMRNDSMFGSLEWYEEQAFFEAHPYMLIVSEDAIRLIEVFSGYTTSKDDSCYDIAISDAADFEAFVDKALRKSNFAFTPTVKAGDRLITLSTCAYAFENARYIVIGKLLTAWKQEKA